MAGIIVEHNWEKEMAKSYGLLNLFLAKQLGDGSVLANLHSDAPVDTYPVAGTLEIDGVLFVKRSAEKRPRWGSVLDEAVGRVIPDLANR